MKLTVTFVIGFVCNPDVIYKNAVCSSITGVIKEYQRGKKGQQTCYKKYFGLNSFHFPRILCFWTKFELNLRVNAF